MMQPHILAKADRKKNYSSIGFLVLLILLLLVGGTLTVTAHPFFNTNSNDWKSATNHKSWSSMLTVDPSKIISLMIKHGGHLANQEIEEDLKLLAKLCHADECRLNILDNQLLIKNFSVRLPNTDKNYAVRINRVYLKWNSYLKPTLEIEMDGIQVLVEFYNILLTRNNWGELKKLGFPPTFEKYSACSEEESLETEDNVFLRIGSIDLSGGINLELTSRTMSKKITTMFFDFEKLDPLEREIRKHAEDNLANIGRRGCTTTEVYTIIQKYFEEVIKHTITDTLGDIVADGGKQTKGNFDKLVGITKASFSKYVEEAGEWTGEQVEKTIEEQLDTLEKSLGKLKEEHRSIFQLAKKVGESNYIQDRLLEKENESKSSASKANHEL